MIDVKELLRRWSAKHGDRKIARETGADRKTIARFEPGVPAGVVHSTYTKAAMSLDGGRVLPRTPQAED